MADIIGREIQFGIATEAVRGTADTTADKWQRNVTCNVVERATHVVDESTRGRFEDGIGRRVVQKYVEGNVAGILHVDVLGWYLSNLYGICVTTTPLAPARQHVFTLKQTSQHVSLTLFVKDGSIQQQTYSNGMISTFKIMASIDDYVRYSADFIASVAAANSDTPSYATEYDFIARDIVIKVASSEAGLTGATAVKAKDVEINFDAGAIRDHVVGSYNPNDIYNARMLIEGTFTLNFTDATYKALYLADTPMYMSITITGEAVLAAAHFPMAMFVFNKVQFMDWNRDGDANSLVTSPIAFRAFFNETDQKQSTATLKNVTTAYVNVPTS